ncbi:MAG: hypothetical protein AAF730_04115 [Bacteroidota bacterium]
MMWNRMGLLVLLLWAVQPAFSQDVDGGTVRHGAWPAWIDTASASDEAEAYALLPFLDDLTLEYRYYHLSDGEPRLELVLAWVAGNRGVRDGQIVAQRQLPDGVILNDLDLAATIVVDDTEVGDLVLDYTALALGPAPETRWHVALPEHWATLFPALSDEAIALLFERGFTLENLRIAHIAFAVADPSERPVRVYPGRPPIAEEAIGRGAEAVIWGTAGRPLVRDVPRAPRTQQPRPSTTGRSTGTRSGRSSRSGGEGDQDEARPATRSGVGTPIATKADGRRQQDDDDDDSGEPNLLPVAMAAFTVVGVVGAAGGSLGYYATYETPFGLSAGLASRNGGVLLMASINEAVLNTGSDQKLNAQALLFRRLGGLPVQPAVGLGALAETRPGGTDFSFGLSFGGVVPLGPLLLHGGYDVLHDDVEMGLALDFGRMRRAANL